MSKPVTKFVSAQGWRYGSHGNPHRVLSYEKFRLPFDPSSSDVTIRMLAAPVHHHDKLMIEGKYPLKPAAFPAVGGVEGVGIIEEVGNNARKDLKSGNLVWINKQTVGTWSTRVVTDSENVDVVPNRADVDVDLLASLSLYHTAHHLLNTQGLSLRPNDTVLIPGATGAVSQILGLMAKRRGLNVFGSFREHRSEQRFLQQRASQIGFAAAVGTAYVKTHRFATLLRDVPAPKAMFNGVGGEGARAMARHLGDNATILSYGSASGHPLQLPNMQIIERGLCHKGFFLPTVQAQERREDRMRIHQDAVEAMTLFDRGIGFRAERYSMQQDAEYGFANCWDAPVSSRKSILRMVGDYHEWMRPNVKWVDAEMKRLTHVWDQWDNDQESQHLMDHKKNMKYYTSFADPFCGEHLISDKTRQELMLNPEFGWRRPMAPDHNVGAASK